MLFLLYILPFIELYFIITSNNIFLIILLLMIEPIILIKLNKNKIKTIPIGIPVANVINIENNNKINYYNLFYYNNYVIGKLL